MFKASGEGPQRPGESVTYVSGMDRVELVGGAGFEPATPGV
jgi:hypothetical protein